MCEPSTPAAEDADQEIGGQGIVAQEQQRGGEGDTVESIPPYLCGMIEAMSEAVLVVDHDGTVVAINRAALSLLDLTEEKAALRPLDEYDQLIAGWRVGDQSFAPDNLRQALQGRTIPRQLATITTSTGQERRMEFTATPLRDERGRVTMAMMVAQDVTREQQVLGYWKAVGSAAQALSTSLDVGQVLESVMDQMSAVLGAEVVIGLWRMDREQNRLELLACRGLSEKSEEMLRSLSVDCDFFICEAARLHHLHYVEDLHRNPPRREMDRKLAEAEGLGSWLSGPLLTSGRLVGVAAYGARDTRRLTEQHRSAIEVVNGLFAVAIDHAFLYQQSQQTRREHERIAKEVREINQRLLAAGLREQALAEEAERQTAQLNALLESQNEGVLVAESAGRIVLLNRRGREICGWPEGVAPRRVEDLQRLDFRRLDGTPLPFEERPLSRALRGERFADHETILVWPSGEERHLLCSGSAIQVGDGKALAIVVYRDVTELRRLEQAKAEYVSIISHDLRSPLTSLTGFVQLLGGQLARKGLRPESELAEKALASARKMNSMIQDLVETARLESGSAVLATQPTDLNALVREIAERVGTPEDRTRLQVETAEGIPTLHLDRDRFERALVNLITNALKYSPPDRPVVVRVEEKDKQAIISVVDQGTGIPAAELPHLFERYYRAKRTRKTEGLGLGLHITRQIVEAHGGRIWVDTAVGKGSTFSIALPVPAGA